MLKAAWIEDLVVEGATRNVPASAMPQPDPGAEKTVAVLMNRRDIRMELEELIEQVTGGDGELVDRLEFEDDRAAFREQMRREQEERIAAARAGVP